MLAILFLLPLIVYLVIGSLVALLLFKLSRSWSLCFLFLVCLVSAPFIYDEIYKRQIVKENSWICDTLQGDYSDPVRLKDTSSKVVLYKHEMLGDLFSSSIKKSTIRSRPREGEREVLWTHFFAVFSEGHNGSGPYISKKSKNPEIEVCPADETERDCAERLLVQQPVLNIVTTEPKNLVVENGVGVGYWVWGSALANASEPHHWQTFSVIRGNYRDGGWPRVWLFGEKVLFTCSTHNLEFENWLIDT